MAEGLNDRAQRVWNGTATKWLVGLSVGMILLLSSTGVAFVLGAVNAVGEKLDDHRETAGHPVITERVTRIEESQRRIRDDLKTLNGQMADFIRQQDRNTTLLERIDKKLDGG